MDQIQRRAANHALALPCIFEAVDALHLHGRVLAEAELSDDLGRVEGGGLAPALGEAHDGDLAFGLQHRATLHGGRRLGA